MNMAATENRLAVFTGPGQVELRTESLPALARGEVLVRVRSCALCTMEQRLWQGRQDDYPIAAGHETAGVVESAHTEGVVGVAPGDRVAIAFLDRCMQCDACRRGETNLCTGKLRGRGPNMFRRIGGLADYAIVPAWKVFPLPEHLSFDEMALCEPLACVVHSIAKVDLDPGDNVLVVGAGTMGQLHVLLARLRGARVTVSDPDPEKRRLAISRGAASAHEPAKIATEMRRGGSSRQADAVFITIGNSDAVAQAVAAVQPGGSVVFYASFPADVATGFDARKLHHDEVRLLGARGQTLEDWHKAAMLLASKVVNVSGLISGRYPLDRVTDALERAIDPATFRIVVNP